MACHIVIEMKRKGANITNGSKILKLSKPVLFKRPFSNTNDSNIIEN